MARLRSLERFARGEVPRVVEGPRCELCSEPIGERHRHVLELGPRAIRCACRPCALLFERSQAGRFFTVPERVRFDP